MPAETGWNGHWPDLAVASPPTTELGRELTVGAAGTVSSSGVGGAELPQATTAQAAMAMIVAARATRTVLNSFMLSPAKLIESTDSRQKTR